MKKKMLKLFLLIFLLFIYYIAQSHLIYLESKPIIETVEEFDANSELLQVHFIDVGNADSSLILFPNNQTMLIDAGEKDESNVVINYLKKHNVNKIDYLIGTHPHSDHIGEMKEIVDEFNIGQIYMPEIPNEFTPSTNTYLSLLESIDKKSLNIISPNIRDKIEINENILIEFMNTPKEIKSDNLNLYSIILKITYNNVSFMFTGDAEKENERIMLEEYSEKELETTVLKVPHHGSGTSSSKEWVNIVKPQFAFIPCGKNNDYGQPHKNIVERYEEIGSEIYRADENGNVVFTTDGMRIAKEN